jgi:hypothetical protein
MSWKPEVIADESGQWVGNGLAFATEEEAQSWVVDLKHRWFAVRSTRVVESIEPVAHVFIGGRACPLFVAEEALRRAAEGV